MNSWEMWGKYKRMELWKRVLLIVPALVAVALVAAWWFLRTDGQDVMDGLMEDKDAETDEIVTTAEGKIEDTEGEIDKLAQERSKIKEEVKENVQGASDIDDRIDAADSLGELERIRNEIAGRLG